MSHLNRRPAGVPDFRIQPIWWDQSTGFRLHGIRPIPYFVKAIVLAIPVRYPQVLVL